MTRFNYLMEGGNYGFRGPLHRTWLEDRGTHWHHGGARRRRRYAAARRRLALRPLVYEGTLLPEKYRGHAVPRRSRQAHRRDVSDDRSKARASRARSEDVMNGGDDTWSRPSDVAVAPDGSRLRRRLVRPRCRRTQHGRPGGRCGSDLSACSCEEPATGGEARSVVGSGAHDALRTAGIGRMLEQLGFAVEDHGNIATPGVSPDEGPPPAHAKYYDAIKTWIRALSERAYSLAGSGAIPLFMGGDHGLSMGSVNGVARYWQERAGRCLCCGSTPMPTTTRPSTTQTGNMHGMSAAFLCGEPGLDGLLGDQPRVSIGPDNSTCSASARSIRLKRSWCAIAALRSPTCARSTSSASAS